MQTLTRLLESQLEPSAIVSDEEAQRQKIACYNAQEGDLGDYDCPRCRNKGRVASYKEGSITPHFNTCGCMKIRAQIERMKESGAWDAMQVCTFDSFLPTRPWQKRARELAQAYAADPRGWFAATGQSGSGKSHLCTAICRALMEQGRTVRYISWRETVDRLKEFRFDPEGRMALLDAIANVDVLYIDDLFKTGPGTAERYRPTPTEMSLTFSMIDGRYRSRKTTIVSSEWMMEELLQIDQAIGGRILERARDNLLAFPRDQRKNYRLWGDKVE